MYRAPYRLPGEAARVTDALLFVLMALAAHRATRLVVADSLLESWRHRLFLRYPPDEHYRSLEARRRPGFPETDEVVWYQHPTPVRPSHPIGVLVDCPWCIGWWICGAVWGAVWYVHGLPLPALWWPAMSSVVALTARLER